MFKQDSLSHAIAHYERQFLYPIASKLEAIEAILDYYLQEAERRMAGHAWDYPVTLLIDEVSHLTSFLETEQEKRVTTKLKEVARFSGQEARGFDLCAVFISQTATGLSWLRKNASMVIAYQVQAMSERLLVCNQDRTIARAMDSWPKGRTCIYGIGIEEGPSIYQQPVILTVPTRSSFEEQYRNRQEQPEKPEEHYFDDVPERSWEQAGTQKKSFEERERIIELAKSGIARRDICKEMGKGKYFYETVKEVLDEEGL